MIKGCDQKIYACNRINFSSDINEAIRAVLNFLFFFTKRFCTHQKAPKAPKALKALKGIKTPRKKHKNANKRRSDYFPLRCFLGAFLFLFACKLFVLFVLVKFLNKEV